MDWEVPESTVGLLQAPGLLALPGIAALSPWGGAGGAGAVCPFQCDGKGQSHYSLMDNTKSEKMPTTCHRRMSQNTTVSLVSGGGLGLGGAVLGCGSGERGMSQGLGLG